MILLHQKLARIVDVASDDATRPYLTGVHVVENGAHPIVEATDGGMAIRARATGPVPSEDFPAVPGMPEAASGPVDVIVPAETWRAAFKAIPKKASLPILQHVAMVRTEEQIAFAATDLERGTVIPSRTIDGRFPDTKLIYPQTTPTVRIAFSAGRMIRLLRALAALADNPKGAVVELELRWTDQDVKEGAKLETPLRLVLNRPEDGYAVDAMLAPTRVSTFAGDQETPAATTQEPDTLEADPDESGDDPDPTREPADEGVCAA